MADEEIDIIINAIGETDDGSFRRIEGKARKSGQRAGARFTKEFGSRLRSLASTATAVTGAIAGIGSALVFRSSIRAAIAQEDAINRLNNQLKLTGELTSGTSQDFQNFASDLQQVTRFGDEAILNQLALAKTFGATNEQAKQIAETAADLSASFGIDLESATRNVAKTLGGFAGELGETIPALKELSTEQLRAGAGVELLAQRFAGAATGELNTFSGILTQAKNSAGDFLEEIGFFITQSPFVIEGLKQITSGFFNLGEEVRDARGGFDFFQTIVEPVLNFSQVLTDNVIPPIELLGNITRSVFASIELAINTTLSEITNFAGAVVTIGESLGVNSEFGTSIRGLAVANANAFEESADRAKNAFASILDFPISEGLASKNAEILENLRTFDEQIKEQARITTEGFGESTENAAENTEKLATGLVDFFSNVKLTIQESEKAAEDAAEKIASQIKDNLARSISGGIQTIVQAVAAGQNAFDAFAKFVLSSFGDLAIQLGQTLILSGIGVESLKALGGAAAIAAGAGLVALGSIIKSFVGGDSSGATAGGQTTSPTSTGGDNFNQFDSNLPGAQPEDIEERQARASVVVNVQGDVLDSDETSLRIAKLLEDSINNQGAVIRTGFA